MTDTGSQADRLGMHELISRRDFLNGTLLASAGRVQGEGEGATLPRRHTVHSTSSLAPANSSPAA